MHSGAAAGTQSAGQASLAAAPGPLESTGPPPQLFTSQAQGDGGPTLLAKLHELQELYHQLAEGNAAAEMLLRTGFAEQSDRLQSLLARPAAPPRPTTAEVATHTSPILTQVPQVRTHNVATEYSPLERGRKVAYAQTSPDPEVPRRSREVQVEITPGVRAPPPVSRRAAACSPFPLHLQAKLQLEDAAAAGIHASPPADIPGPGGGPRPLGADVGRAPPRRPSPRLAGLGLGPKSQAHRHRAKTPPTAAPRPTSAAALLASGRRPTASAAAQSKPPEVRLLFADPTPVTQMFGPVEAAVRPTTAQKPPSQQAQQSAGAAGPRDDPAPSGLHAQLQGATVVLTRAQAQRMLVEDVLQQQIQQELEKHRRERRERQAARKKRKAHDGATVPAGPAAGSLGGHEHACLDQAAGPGDKLKRVRTECGPDIDINREKFTPIDIPASPAAAGRAPAAPAPGPGSASAVARASGLGPGPAVPAVVPLKSKPVIKSRLAQLMMDTP